MDVWVVVGFKICDNKLYQYSVELFKTSRAAHKYSDALRDLPYILVLKRKIPDGVEYD